MRWPWKREDTELDLELQYHLEAMADAYVAEGMPREEALRRARREFGGVERVKDECRDESRWRWAVEMGQDLRFGWRMMKKTPAISVAAVATLALGIGATTAILTLADTLLWRSLPVAAPEQLSEILWFSKDRVGTMNSGSSGSTYPDGPLRVADFFSFAAYQNMRESLKGKAQISGHLYIDRVSTAYEGRVAVADSRAVTGNFFQTLGLQPLAGRLLQDRDEADGSAPVVVLTHRFWVGRLGGQLDAIGKPMRVNNRVYTIAGVLPAAFTGVIPGEGTDLYIPLPHSPQMLKSKSWYRKGISDSRLWILQLLARRAPGVSEEELRAALTPAYAASWAVPPKSAEGTPQLRISEASRGLGAMRRRFGDPVWTLLGLVSLVLLIACANIANLLLARSVEREKEAAMRVSLGCGEGRLMRQFFTESLLLAGIGGVLSIAVAAGLAELMVSLIPGTDALTLSPERDPRALFGAAVVTLGTALLFGLYPAWRTARVGTAPALKEGVTLSRARWAPARLLVVAQVALGVLLVAAALVFTSRLNEVIGRDAGFERGHLLLFDLRPGEIGYKGARLQQFYLSLEERLGTLGGVMHVGLAQTRPMRGGGYWDSVMAPGGKDVGAAVQHGNPAFLAALGVPLVAGREARPQEKGVVILGENLARELGVGLGARVTMSKVPLEVIGIARTAQYSNLEEPHRVAYLPFPYENDAATVVVRTTVAPMAILGAVREAIGTLDKDLPLVDVYTMEQQISRTLQREQLFAWLCGSFGVLALVLCTVGLYGLMSHTTARRTGEIGIRMALGATRGVVMRQVLREGLVLAVAGLVFGLPLAAYAARVAVLQKILPEGATPYWTLGAALSVLTLAAVLAVLGPALRASSIEPMQALRRG
jgi:predicted permease